MGILIVILTALGIARRPLDRWMDRRLDSIERAPDALHRMQMMRWVAGQGPDPREALFRNGVPVEQNEAPELSSLSWPRTSPLAPARQSIRTTGTSTGMASSTGMIPG